MKVLKFLWAFWLELLILIRLFVASANSSGVEQAIYTVGFIICSELLYHKLKGR